MLLQRDGLEGGNGLLLQPDASSTRLFRGTMVEVGYVGNQARHLRNVMPFNMAMPEGYDKVRLQDGTPLPISGAPVTLPGRASCSPDRRRGVPTRSSWPTS